MNEWAVVTNGGHSDSLTPECKALNELACQYQAVKRNTDFRRETYSRRSKDPATDKELQVFLEQDAATERAEREVFARALKKYRDAHEFYGPCSSSTISNLS